MHTTHVTCSTCGKRVSNDVMLAGDLVVRAYIECPECIEDNGPRLLTVEEVATRLRVSKMSVYRLTERGDLPVIRVGRTQRIRESDFTAYVEAGGSPI